METFDLDITEANELTFKIQIDGAETPANIRLVCENADMSYMFKARQGAEMDTFDFVVPPMKNKLREGVYKARVEVLIENKYFSPVEFDINFLQPVKVVAEAVIKKAPEPQKIETKVAVTGIQLKSKTPGVSENAQFISDHAPKPAVQPAKPGSLRDKFSKGK